MPPRKKDAPPPKGSQLITGFFAPKPKPAGGASSGQQHQEAAHADIASPSQQQQQQGAPSHHHNGSLGPQPSGTTLDTSASAHAPAQSVGAAAGPLPRRSAPPRARLRPSDLVNRHDEPDTTVGRATAALGQQGQQPPEGAYQAHEQQAQGQGGQQQQGTHTEGQGWTEGIRACLRAKAPKPLNAQQMAAAAAPGDQPLLIVAGAGTGKTTTLMSRVRVLILEQGISPYHILLFTYTNKAAEELRSRLEDMGLPKNSVPACTFHSWCWGILRVHHKAAGFARQPVVWIDSQLKEAVSVAIRRQELQQVARYVAEWLGEPIGTEWKRLIEAAKEKHPRLHNKALEYAITEAEKRRAQHEKTQKAKERKLQAKEKSGGGTLIKAGSKKAAAASSAASSGRAGSGAGPSASTLLGAHGGATGAQQHPQPATFVRASDLLKSQEVAGAGPSSRAAVGGFFQPISRGVTCVAAATAHQAAGLGPQSVAAGGSGGTKRAAPPPDESSSHAFGASKRQAVVVGEVGEKSKQQQPSATFSGIFSQQQFAGVQPSGDMAYAVVGHAPVLHVGIAGDTAGIACTTASLGGKAWGDGQGQQQQQQQLHDRTAGNGDGVSRASWQADSATAAALSARSQGAGGQQQQGPQDQAQQAQQAPQQQQQQGPQGQAHAPQQQQQQQQRKRPLEDAAGAGRTKQHHTVEYLFRLYALLKEEYEGQGRQQGQQQQQEGEELSAEERRLRDQQARGAGVRLPGTKPSRKYIKFVLDWIDGRKRMGFRFQDFEGSYATIFGYYTKYLHDCNAVDFNDLLSLTRDLLHKEPHIRQALCARHRYLLVDEFQDCNKIQTELVNLLSLHEDRAAVTVVGDDAQSIYRFRGASGDTFGVFKEAYDHVGLLKTLELNYRSRPNILLLADHVLAGACVIDKVLRPTKPSEGQQPVEFVEASTPDDEADAIVERIQARQAEGVDLADMAVLFRCFKGCPGNWYGRLKEALLHANIPFRVVRTIDFMDRAEVQDVLAYLRLALNPDDDPALLRILNRPPRGLPPKVEDALRQRQEHEISQRQQQQGQQHAGAQEGVSLLTVAKLLVREARSGRGELTERQGKALQAFLDLMGQLHDVACGSSPAEVITFVLHQDTGYLAHHNKSLEAKRKKKAAMDGTEEAEQAQQKQQQGPVAGGAEKGNGAEAEGGDDDDEGGGSSSSSDGEGTDEEEGQEENEGAGADGAEDAAAAAAAAVVAGGPVNAGAASANGTARSRVAAVAGQTAVKAPPGLTPPLKTLFHEAVGFIRDTWRPPLAPVSPLDADPSTQQQGHGSTADARSSDAGGREQAGPRHSVPSLFQLCSVRAMSAFNAGAMRRGGVPESVLAFMFAASGRGTWALQEFLAHLSLAISSEDLDDSGNKKDAGKKPKGVLISTIHAAKGLEYDTVFIPHFVDGLMPLHPRDPEKLRTGLTSAAAGALPSPAQDDEDHYAEERRLAHVAITRAMERLYILSYRADNRGRGRGRTTPSRFSLKKGDPGWDAVLRETMRPETPAELMVQPDEPEQ